MMESHSKGTHYSYFCNRECEYFPCHAGNVEDFNCLFCYCPLYALGERCGGDFLYLPDGTKDCSGCLFPHLRENYGAVIKRLEAARTKVRNQHTAAEPEEPKL